MDLSLNAKRHKVLDAKMKLDAAVAMERHSSLKAKENCNKLILSAKGLSVIFMSGAVKGAMSKQNMTVATFSKLISKKMLAGWLSSSE